MGAPKATGTADQGGEVSAPSTPQNATPMMKQWRELKASARGALLFFRLGDFYELFEEDAIQAAPVMGVQLTSRNKSSADAVALCGVPVAHLENYLNKLLDKGFMVALAEQTEDPAATKTLVRREIVQWFSPGMRLMAQEDRPHYVGFCAGRAEGEWVVAAADVSTGHLILEQGLGLEELADLVARLPIEDLRFPAAFYVGEKLPVAVKRQSIEFLVSESEARPLIHQAFSILSDEDSPARLKAQKQALGSLLNALKSAHPRERLTFALPHQTPHAVWMPAATRRNLHLFEPDGKSLFDLLDRTATSMGRRWLKTWLSTPLQNLDELQMRQQLVSHFKTHSTLRRNLRSNFAQMIDLHRWFRRRSSPPLLMQLLQTLQAGDRAASELKLHEGPALNARFIRFMQMLTPLMQSLRSTLQESVDAEWGWIRPGVNKELDELRTLKQNSHSTLSELENRLREETGIGSLKIKFHQVFGYVMEVTATHKERVPSTFRRIQTLANAERFKTEELERLEEKILSVDARLKEAESSELRKLYDTAEANRSDLLNWAECLSQLDAAQSLAEVSHQLGWTTPITLPDSHAPSLHIREAVHPLVQGSFVPLSLDMRADRNQILLLTGPNMAGKSTLLRLAATTALLHQIGSDVPARQATLSLFDRIACRMGAQDHLTEGQSTFFVEMREVATMLEGATPKSFLIFDEIGRGTSTYDGMSLAWAITEDVQRMRPISLIATHYLELAELEKSLPRIESYHLGVQEQGGHLVFTRKLMKGPASRSYGIQVARLAQVNRTILKRAQEKLEEFERKRPLASASLPLFAMKRNPLQSLESMDDPARPV